jgi:hypothetical protein
MKGVSMHIGTPRLEESGRSKALGEAGLAEQPPVDPRARPALRVAPPLGLIPAPLLTLRSR